MRSKLSWKLLLPPIIVSFSAGILAICLSATLLAGPGWWFYDGFLGLSRSEAVPGDYLAIYPKDREGSRRSAGEALEVLRLLDEFGAKDVVIEGDAFDGGEALEELAALHKELPALVDREEANIEKNIRALFDAIRSGSVPAGELGRYVDGLVAIVEKGGQRIKEASSQGGSATLRALGAQEAWLGGVEGSFSGFAADPDGVVRRVEVLRTEDGHPLPRAELATLMSRLGDPSLEVGPGRVVLRAANLPGGRVRNLVIPVDAGGHALLGWPGPGGSSGPRELPLESLLGDIDAEKGFITALETMEAGGLLGGEGLSLLSRYRHAELLAEGRTTGSAAEDAEWRQARAAFFDAAMAYFREGHEAGLVGALEVRKNSPGVSDGELALLDARIGEIQRSYAEAKRLVEELAVRRASLATGLRGAFVFITLAKGPEGSAAGLVDCYGRPTDPALAGAVFAAGVLAQDQPAAAPAWVALSLSLVLALAAALSLRAIEPGMSRPRALVPVLCIGMGTALAGFALPAAAFLFFGFYVPPLPSVLGSLVACIAASACSGRLVAAGARG